MYLQRMNMLIKTTYQENSSKQYPAVLGMVEVSCTAKFSNGIEELRRLIYDVAVNLEIDGNGKGNVNKCCFRRFVPYTHFHNVLKYYAKQHMKKEATCCYNKKYLLVTSNYKI